MKSWKKATAAVVGTVIGVTTAVVGIAPGAASASVPACTYGRDLRTQPRTGTLSNGVMSFGVCGTTNRVTINQIYVEYKRIGGSGYIEVSFTWEGVSRDGTKSYQREPKPVVRSIKTGGTGSNTWMYKTGTPFQQYTAYPCVRGVMISGSTRYHTEMECK